MDATLMRHDHSPIGRIIYRINKLARLSNLNTAALKARTGKPYKINIALRWSRDIPIPCPQWIHFTQNARCKEPWESIKRTMEND